MILNISEVRYDLSHMMSPNLVIRMLTLLIPVFMVGIVHAQAAQLGNAFGWRSLAPLAPLAADAVNPAIIRSNYLNVNFTLFRQQANTGTVGDLITLNLFPGVMVQAQLIRIERRSATSYTWIGKVPNQPDSSVILTFVNGSMAANVNVNGQVFEITDTGMGMHVVHQLNHAAFPPETAPIPVSNPAPLQQKVLMMGDSAAFVDVMVVYTPAARVAAGGAAAMAAKIQLAIDETNTGYFTSQVAHRLRLVHSQEIAYIEANPVNSGTDLSRLKGTADGFMDNVHALRNTYAADEVVLLANWGRSTCGIAYINSSASAAFATWAFAAVDQSCATGYYSFGHELGHNMSARHDTFVDPVATPFAYGHGYVHLGATRALSWRTIMAYSRACSLGCTRKLFWSNPNVNYVGISTGAVATADNHRTLNNTALITANFRQAVVATPATVGISLNAPTFAAGSTMTMTGTTVASAPAITRADIYYALQLPNSTLLIMQPGGSFNSAVTPFQANVIVPNASSQLLSYTLTGLEPVGNYTWYAALMQPGSLTVMGALTRVTFTVR